MKKIVLAVSTASYLLLAPSAFADTLCPNNSNFSILCNLQLGRSVGNLINLIFIIAVVAALLYLVYGGFRWLTSTGDKANVAAAREHIVAAIIGLVIIFLSYFVLNILIAFFIPGFSLSTFNIPNINQ